MSTEGNPGSVLIVAWQFPPWNQVASGRMASWAAAFANAGWKVTVITPKKYPAPIHGPLNFDYQFPPGVEICELPLPLSKTGLDHKQKRLRRKLSEVLEYFRRSAWSRKAVREGRARVAEADVLISSFGPWQVHAVAAKIARAKPGIPWHADYRDQWTGRDLFKGAMWTTRWMMRLDEAYEKRTIAAASLLSTVSEPIARHLESSLGIRCETIYNGFEVEPETPELRPVDDDRFDLVYTGGIYRKYYDPTPMFRVLRKLRDEGELPARFCLHFYGQSAEFPRLEGWLDEFGIADLVERHGTLSRDDVARVQREAHALFFLAWTNENADGVLSGKLFEYFAAGRPILSVGCGLKPAVGQLIARTGTGVVVRDETDGVLEQALRTLVRGETPDWFKPDTGAIETFRRDVQGGKVVELAEALVEEKKY